MLFCLFQKSKQALNKFHKNCTLISIVIVVVNISFVIYKALFVHSILFINIDVNVQSWLISS